jgi:hypothetical protein
VAVESGAYGIAVHGQQFGHAGGCIERIVDHQHMNVVVRHEAPCGIEKENRVPILENRRPMVV